MNIPEEYCAWEATWTILCAVAFHTDPCVHLKNLLLEPAMFFAPLTKLSMRIPWMLLFGTFFSY